MTQPLWLVYFSCRQEGAIGIFGERAALKIRGADVATVCSRMCDKLRALHMEPGVPLSVKRIPDESGPDY